MSTLRKTQTTSFTAEMGQQTPAAVEPGRALIQLNDITKVFHTAAGDYTALKNINLCFGEGEFVSIMGKSGSGKSTLINMITGIDHPTSGRVSVGNSDIHHMSEGQLASWRGRTMGIVFQFFQLLPMLTVLENTILPMDFCNMYTPGERAPRAMALLEMVNLQDEANKLPAALSGGQQQTAAIARALANDPPLIIADEPTGNLDSRTAENVLNIFYDLANNGKTILIVTHDPNLTERSTRRVYISDGQLINEVVSQALPMLSHSQMLKITQQAQPLSLEAGKDIARQGNPQAGLYIVTRGQVEIHRTKDREGTEFVGYLNPGQYFSELELSESPDCNLSFSASPGGEVEALWLSSAAFQHILHENQRTEQRLCQQAQQRCAQYCLSANPGGG
jgi:putative ABC transport system ATP-binding protein